MIFLPSGKRGKVARGTSILDASRILNVDLDSVCGGRGICSKCQVSPSFGNFSKFGIESNPTALSTKNSIEDRYESVRGLKTGRRLGCQARILENVVIDVPPESQLHKQIIRKDVNTRPIKMAPATKLFYIEVTKPDLEVASGDYDRVKAALNETWNLRNVDSSLSVIQSIQNNLREGKWAITCAIFYNLTNKTHTIVQTWPGYFDGSIYGIALDLGSTTIAGHLCNLQSGKVVFSTGLMNPQIKFGEDLMSRVSYAMMNELGCNKLALAVREGINKLIKEICNNSNISKSEVLECCPIIP